MPESRRGLTSVILPLLFVFKAALEASESNRISFARQIAPVLIQKCLSCHSEAKPKGKYRVESFDHLLKPGDSGEVPIVAGKPESSAMFRLITTTNEDDRMPQKAEALPQHTISLIRRWIEQGANFDGEDRAQPLQMLIASSHPPPPEAYSRAIPIRALAFSQSAEEIFVGGYHEVTIWNVGSGSLQKRISNFAQDIYALALSSDGRFLAVGSGTPGQLGQVNLIDIAEGGPGKVIATMRDVVLAVAFSAASDRLAVAGADNSIRLHSFPEGNLERTIEQHADWIMGVSFSPDGALLASASRDKTARLFDVKTGELEATYAGHSDAVFGVGFSPNGKRLISGGRDKELHLWDTKEAKKVEETKVAEIIRLIVRSNFVFTCSTDNTIRLHTVGDKIEAVRTFSGHTDIPYAIDYHESSKRMATGSYDGEVRIWNVDNGELIRSFVAVPGIQTAGAKKTNALGKTP